MDHLLPNVNVVPSHFWFPLVLPCLQVDPMAARKKGDLVLYSGDLFRTEARKPPSCPLVKPASAEVRPGYYCHRSRVHTIAGVALAQKLEVYVWFRGRSLVLHRISGSRLRPVLDRSCGSAGARKLMLLLVYDCFCASISPRRIHPKRDYLIAESC